ncbi:MAG: HEAT repeat domain-containing protein [Deltaproteobacteria bacterium]|nr:HEAT repeat domain-containing protein [Deltaproteobacteria bacterium]
MLVIAVCGRFAYADRIGDLTAMLSSSSDKTRLSAVVSLAKLGDKRALKPLVTALHDPNAQVRALAATGLGKLGHKAALPELQHVATDDTDDTVRTRAREAAMQVAKANHIAADMPGEEPAQARAHTSGFGRSPHAVEDKPDLYVLIKGANDDSPGKADKTTRKANADILKAAILDQLKTAPQVTMTADVAQRWGLDARHIDLSVVKLEVVQSGGYVEMQTELRLAISDDTGKMLSFLSGGAKVQVPKSKFNLNALPMMRRDALEGAMRGMFDKLLAHLRQTSQS